METIFTDLAIGLPFVKGQNLPVRNCWHFSTDGTVRDVLFRDGADYVLAMNRIYLVARKFNIIILAFCLMDNHVHFVLYGDLEACRRFMHEYVRNISMTVARRHGLSRDLRELPIHHQEITDDAYLKTAVCYVIKNPVAAGLSWQVHDYPWSSGPLYFRSSHTWAAPAWDARKTTLEGLSAQKKEEIFHTREPLPDTLEVVGDLILPSNYIPTELVEQIFKSHKSYHYFLSRSKEEDIESRGGAISRLSLPDGEMRQHKREIMRELYGKESSRELDTTQRLRLAKEIRRRYNCSLKQISRLVGLSRENLEAFVK